MNNFVTVYELLGLIKYGKAPKMIKYKDNNYIFTGYDYHCVLTDIEKGFVEYRLIGNYNQDLQSILNEKVEIIEEDKDIEEIHLEDMYEHSQVHVIDIELQNKINELIKEVNKLRKDRK